MRINTGSIIKTVVTLNIISCSIFYVGISSCTDNFMKSKTKDQRIHSVEILGVQDENGNVSGTIQGSSLSSQYLRAKSGTIAGAAIALPVGALSIPISITIGEGASLVKAGHEIGLSSESTAASPSVSFIPTSSVEAANPFVLSIPITITTGLDLSDGTPNADSIAIVYNCIAVENGIARYMTGIILGKDITIGNKVAQFQATKFGTYQMVYLPSKITAKLSKISDRQPQFKSSLTAPQSLTYSDLSKSVNTLVVGTNYTFMPKSSAGQVDSYQIKPDLPTGMSLNIYSGVLSGAPTSSSIATKYIVTAFNDKGSTEFKFVLATTTSLAPPPTQSSVLLSSTSSMTANPKVVTVVFSESVTGFEIADISVSNGTTSALTGSGTTYSFNVTPTANGSISIQVNANSVTGSTVSNAISNALTLTHDTTAPTVALSTAAGTHTNAASFVLDLVFSENITGLQTGDFSISNGTVTSVTGTDGGSTYQATVNPSGDGSITITLYASAVTDVAGNVNAASSTFTMIKDSVAPSSGTFGASSGVSYNQFTLNWNAASDTYTSAGNMLYLVCTGLSAGDISTEGGCTSHTILQNWTAGTTDLLITGLNPSTTYYYNVIAKDQAGNMFIYPGKSQTTGAETVAPTPGSFQATTNITHNQLTLNWSPASDNISAVGNLQYLVCLGLAQTNVDTAAACVASTIVLSWTTNINSAVVSSLTPGVTKYYNVIVRDEAGNTALYSPISATTITAASSTIDDVPAGTQRQSFYDTVNSRHWQIIDTGPNIQCYYSTDGVQWTQSTSIAEDATNISLHFAVISSTPYVFLTYQASTNDIIIKRGLIGPTSITFETSLYPFLGTSASDTYLMPKITMDSSTNLWIATFHWNGFQNQLVVKRSINLATGNLSTWNTQQTLGLPFDGPKELAILRESSADVIMVVAQRSNSVFAYRYEASSWSVETSTTNFGWIDLNSTLDIRALAIAPNGDIYVGGQFTNAFGISGANNIMKWDGLIWSALGSGTDGIVYSIYVHSPTEIYIGGQFSYAGGSPTNNIAMWNGSSTWTGLSTGVNNTVRSITAIGSDIYVGGLFTAATNVSTPVSNSLYIAKWDGSAWSALGGGLNVSVTSLFVDGSNLYIGGGFINANGNANADGIVKWDGTTYVALGTGISNGQVNSILKMGSDIVIAGYFGSVGGVGSTSNIAKWNGTTWSALQTGLNQSVYDIMQWGSNLIAIGYFTSAGGITGADFIAKWNGTTWQPLGKKPPTIRSVGGYGRLLLVPGAPSTLLASHGSTMGLRMFEDAIADGVNSISAVTDSSNNHGLIYSMTQSNEVIFQKYNGVSWSEPTSLAASGSNVALSSIGTNEIVGIWQSGAQIDYKKFNGVAWDASPTTLVPSSVAGRTPICAANTSPTIPSLLLCQITIGSANPFSKLFWTISH